MAYEECLSYSLSQLNLAFKRQVPMPVRFRTVLLDCGYRLDLVVEDLLVVELKAVTEMHRIFEAQLLTYLKLARKHSDWCSKTALNESHGANSFRNLVRFDEECAHIHRADSSSLCLCVSVVQ